MKEIGGYFGLEKFTGEEYHADLIPVNSGRNALLYILKARQVKKLYIPRFLCDSVSELCKREGYAYEEYLIDNTFLPVFSKTLENGEWLYIVNYFGQLTNDCIHRLKIRYGNIIIDNVQAFFQKPISGIDTIYSCRKFFGVPDGGYVSTDRTLDEVLPVDSSMNRMRHILGRFEKSASEYYGDFQNNDELFYERPLRSMSALTCNIMRGINYRLVCKQRETNYAVLHSELGAKNKLQLRCPEGPYCYPFYCENGMNIKRYLATKKIYIPTLWPNLFDMDNTLEKDFAENILPLPCDQRYNDQDMQRIIREIIVCIDQAH